MINYNFPLIGGKLIERKTAQWRAEGIAKGRAEGIAKGRAEGIAKGRAEECARWSAWNSRRMEAERGGVPFHEPPPDEGARVSPTGKERQ